MPIPHPTDPGPQAAVCGRRHATAGLLAALAAPALAPAWAQEAPQAAPLTPSTPSSQQPTLHIVGPWELTSLAPASSGFMLMNLQVTETLLNADDQGRPRPGLARQWHTSADGLTWRFALRPHARFHNGDPVTASAVAHSLERARRAPAVLSQAPIAAIAAQDPHTVQIRLHRPHSALLAQLAHYSALVLSPASLGPGGKVVRIVGSGPFRITELVPPQRVQTEAFTEYDGSDTQGPAARSVLPRAPQRVAYLAASRAETRALMAEGGQAHLAYGLDPASLRRLRRHGRVSIATALQPRTVLLKVNAAWPGLHDVRVRRALSLCLDRTGIAQALMGDASLAATQLLPPTLADWHDPSLPPLQHDPAAARALLREAGWQEHGDGLRNGQGQPLRLTLRTFLDRPELPLIATALQEQWRQVGIAVQVHIGNAGDIPLGHRDGSLQMGLTARNYANIPDPTGTLAGDLGPQGSDWGAMGWHQPSVVQALAELMGTSPTAARARALRATVTRALQEDLPLIPVAWYRQHVAVHRSLEGVTLDPLERSYRITDMHWSAT